MKSIYPFLVLFFSNLALAQIDVFPSSIDFGWVRVGSFARRTSWIRNQGDSELELNFSSNCYSPFWLRNLCPRILGAGQSCDVSVEFSPRNEGYETCYIRVATATESKMIYVSGRGERRR